MRRHSDPFSGEVVSSRLRATKSFPEHHAVRALKESDSGMQTCRSLTPSGVDGRLGEGAKSSRADKHSKSWSVVHGGLVQTLKDEDSREARTSRSREPRQARRLTPKEVVTSARQEKAGAQNCEPKAKAKGTSYSYELSLWKRRAAEAHFIRHSVRRKELDTAPCADGLVKSPPVTLDKIRRMNLQDETNDSRPQSLPLNSIQPGMDRARSQGRQSSLPLFDAPTLLSRSSWSDLRLHRNRSEELPRADVKTEDAAPKSALRSRRKQPNKVVGRGSSAYRPTAQLARVRREVSGANEAEKISTQFSGLFGVVAVLSTLAFLMSIMFFVRVFDEQDSPGVSSCVSNDSDMHMMHC